MNSAQIHRLQCSKHLIDQPGALREQFERDGYVYCRGIVPVEKITSLRLKILDACAAAGWIDRNAEPGEALTVIAPVNEGEPAFFDVYDVVQKLEEFHALSHHPKLMTLMRALLGDSAFPHPLGIARLMFPFNTECTTPPHQDYPNNQGTPDLYACWIPLGDCPLELGGVAVMEGSHHCGVLPLKYSLGAGGREAVLDPSLATHRWLGTDYQAGDVLVFHSQNVHCALDNRSPGRMRISCDFRYQRQGEALVERSLRPHFERFGWEEVYRDWQSREYQYYWKSLDYTTVAWDDSMHHLPEEHLREAVRMQRAYDSRRKSMVQS